MFYDAKNQSKSSLMLFAAAASHSLAGSVPTGIVDWDTDGLGN